MSHQLPDLGGPEILHVGADIGRRDYRRSVETGGAVAWAWVTVEGAPVDDLFADGSEPPQASIAERKGGAE